MERLCDAVADRESPETLFALARPRLLRLIEIRIPATLVRRVDAEDVVQETLAIASRRFEEFLQQRKVPVFVWLRGLAIERLIELQRRHLGAEKRSVNREVKTREWLNQSSCDLLERWAQQGVELRGGSLFIRTLLERRGLGTGKGMDDSTPA